MMTMHEDNPYAAPQQINSDEDRIALGFAPRGDDGSPIVVRYRASADEILAARCEHARRLSPLRPLMITLHVVIGLWFLLGSLFVAGMAMREGDGPDDPFVDRVSIGLFLLGIYWFILRQPINRWILRRATQRLSSNADVEWRIWPGCLESDSKLLQSPALSGPIESITRTTVGWECYVGGARTEQGILLSLNPALFHWLPRHGFVGDDDYDLVAEWAGEKIPRFVDVVRR